MVGFESFRLLLEVLRILMLDWYQQLVSETGISNWNQQRDCVVGVSFSNVVLKYLDLCLQYSFHFLVYFTIFDSLSVGCLYLIE